ATLVVGAAVPVIARRAARVELARRRAARGVLAVCRPGITLLGCFQDTVAANLSQVARESEVGVGTVVRVACRHELPIGLKDERVGLADVAPDFGDHLAPRAEARIEAAVGVVAHEGAVLEAASV